MNYNSVTLMGRMTRDVDIRAAGKSNVGSFSLAINEKWKDASGNDKESTCFVDCEVWGKQADILAQYTKKGHALFVTGKLKQDTWEKDGQKHSKIKVTVNNFQFLGGNRDQSSTPSSNYSPNRSSAPAPSTPPPSEPDMPPDENLPDPPF